MKSLHTASSRKQREPVTALAIFKMTVSQKQKWLQCHSTEKYTVGTKL